MTNFEHDMSATTNFDDNKGILQAHQRYSYLLNPGAHNKDKGYFKLKSLLENLGCKVTVRQENRWECEVRDMQDHDNLEVSDEAIILELNEDGCKVEFVFGLTGALWEVRAENEKEIEEEDDD